MLTRKHFLEEQQDCADMLGVTLKEYQDDIKNTKAPRKENVNDKKVQYDNSVLKIFGVDETILKRRKNKI